MKLLIKFLTPEYLTAFVFIISITLFISISLWRSNDIIHRIVLMFLIMCGSIILINGLFDIFPQKIDSIQDFIPTSLKIADMIRSGITNIYVNFGNFLDDKIERVFVYTFWVGLIFVITKDSIPAGSFLSSIFGALTIYMIYHIAKDLFDSKTAKLTALLLALSPFYIYMSCVIMRDTMVTFVITLFYRIWLLYDKAPERRYLWLMILTLFLVGLLRPPMMIVILSSILIFKLFFEKRENQSLGTIIFTKYLKIVFVMFGILILGAYFTGAINIKSIMESRLGSSIKYTQMETINNKIEGNSGAGSFYYPVPKHDSIVSILEYMPLLVVYFIASPFPWQITKATQLAALADSSVIWVICFLFFLEARSFARRNKKWAIILFTYLILGICASSIVQTNMGGSERHRIMFTIFLLPFAAHKILNWRRGKKREHELRGRYLVRGSHRSVWKGGTIFGTGR